MIGRALFLCGNIFWSGVQMTPLAAQLIIVSVNEVFICYIVDFDARMKEGYGAEF